MRSLNIFFLFLGGLHVWLSMVRYEHLERVKQKMRLGPKSTTRIKKIMR